MEVSEEVGEGSERGRQWVDGYVAVTRLTVTGETMPHRFTNSQSTFLQSLRSIKLILSPVEGS